MFGALKKIFHKSAPLPTPSAPPPVKSPPRASASPHPGPLPGSADFSPNSGEDLIIPFSGIISQIPKELCGKMLPANLDNCTFSVPKSTILAQLAHGAVKVPFGDLRRSAPASLFINSSSEDARLVDLPLGYIFNQLRSENF